MTASPVWCQRCGIVVNDAGVCSRCGFDYAQPLDPAIRRLMAQTMTALRISAEDSDPSRGAPSAALVESSADVPRGRHRSIGQDRL